ncbi:MAG: aldo/keto reductase, partial [Halocynthiibacter sp.]
AIGGAMWGGSDDQKSVAAIRASIDHGISLIDTAPGYGLGHSEELVGQAIKGRRDKVTIATKCGLNWHHKKGEYFFDQYGKSVHRYLGAEGIIHELEESLRRLGTDYVDVYITHWQDASTPVAETLATLERLKEQGKIRAIGASNLTEAELAEYIRGGPLDCIQERFSMIDPGIKDTLLPLIKSLGVATLSYSPLAMGLLTGKIAPERRFVGDDVRADDPRFSAECRVAVRSFEDELGPILRDLGA